MTEPTRLTGKTFADLIAIPGVMLGFTPAESIVVLGFAKNGKRVEFCARMDTAHVQQAPRAIATQVETAAARIAGGEVIVLGYSENPQTVAATMATLIDVMDVFVVECLAIAPAQWWSVIGDTIAGEPTTYDTRAAVLSLQALAADMPVLQDRAAAVAAVQAPKIDAADYPAMIRHSNAAAVLVAAQSEAEQMDAAVKLATNDTELTTDQRHQLAALANTPGLTSVLDVCDHDAATARLRLAEARSVTPASIAGGVLAALGIACWKDGEGAQLADCITQLERLDPNHPMARVLATILSSAIPPNA